MVGLGSSYHPSFTSPAQACWPLGLAVPFFCFSLSCVISEDPRFPAHTCFLLASLCKHIRHVHMCSIPLRDTIQLLFTGGASDPRWIRGCKWRQHGDIWGHEETRHLPQLHVPGMSKSTHQLYQGRSHRGPSPCTRWWVSTFPPFQPLEGYSTLMGQEWGLLASVILKLWEDSFPLAPPCI